MTGVDRVGGSAPVARVAGQALAGGAVFSLRADATEEPAAAAPAAEVMLGGMLVLQEAESGAVRDREARRRAHDLLGALVRLQRALLAGQEDIPALHRLANLADDVPQAADEDLRAAVAAVVLRARVELARHRRFTSG